MWINNILKNLQPLQQKYILLQPQLLILLLIIINEKIRQSVTSVRISKVKTYQQA
jgi:hypothetical protein